MTSGTNSSLGVLRTEAAKGWESRQPVRFLELSKSAHSRCKSPIRVPNHHSATHPERGLLSSVCLHTSRCPLHGQLQF